MRTYKYFSEDIDRLTDLTDSVLSKAINVYGEYVIANLKYQDIYTSLTSISVSYDTERVQTSHMSYDDRLVALAELSQTCDDLKHQYDIERKRLYNLLQNIDFTADEYYVMHHRYLVTQALSFEQIAKKHGHMDRKRAFYLYTKAYIKAANYIEKIYKKGELDGQENLSCV